MIDARYIAVWYISFVFVSLCKTIDLLIFDITQSMQ